MDCFSDQLNGLDLIMNELFSQEYIVTILRDVTTWALSKLPTVLLLIILFILLRWVLKKLLRIATLSIKSHVSKSKANAAENEKRAETLTGLIRSTIIVSLWGVFLLILLKELGVDIGPILAGAGIIGLAVGFGAQELVRDSISGFFIILEDRIRTGDVVSINGTGGLVESINLRAVTLRDLSGIVHTFQNGKIDTLANMTKEWSAMVFDVGVAYKENVDQVIETIKEVGEGLRNDVTFGPKIIEPIEVFGLDKFGDSAIVIKARLKTLPIEQWGVGREFNRRLKAAFDQKGIEIPFPHRTIYWGEDISPLKINKD